MTVTVWCHVDFFLLFAIAKIRRIGHDHHTPVQVVVNVLDNQAVTQGENKLPHGTPNIFIDSESPIELLLGGLMRGAPDPLTPLYGAEIFFGGVGSMTDGLF